MVNDSNAQEIVDRDPHTQITTIEMSDRAQNQSSRQALKASNRSNRTRRSFIESTGLSSDMKPDLAVVIKDALALTAQAINKANDDEPRVTHSHKKKNCDETSVYKDSYNLKKLTR